MWVELPISIKGESMWAFVGLQPYHKLPKSYLNPSPPPTPHAGEGESEEKIQATQK